MRRFTPLLLALLAPALIIMNGCDKLGINDDNNNDQGIVLTLNVATPSNQSFVGKTIRASLWSNWGDETPYKYVDVVAGGSSATLNITNIASGSYHVVVAIDDEQNGFGDAPAERGDRFWAALNVPINENDTITWPNYAWQRSSDHIFGIQNIPDGNDGKICALGLFAQGRDIFNNFPEPDSLMGGGALIYNNSAVISINPPSGEDYGTWELPEGIYDIWALIDMDNDPEDWFDTIGIGNPISEGDYIYSRLNWEYDEYVNDEDFLITANFALYQPLTVTFNLSFRAEDGMDGHEVILSLWDGLEDDNVKYMKFVNVDGTTATGTLNLISPETLNIVIFADKTNDGFMGDDEMLDQGDYLWGALHVPFNTDQTVTVQSQWWQTAHSLIFLIDNLPTGCEGKVVSLGIFDDGANPFSSEAESYLGCGAAVYNRSAVIAVTPHVWDTTYFLPNGDYDVYSVIDMDGTFDDYETPGYNPLSQGDYYCKFDLSYEDDIYTEIEPLELHGSYTPAVGVVGNVTCPTFIPGQGNIYLFLFKTNPLFDSTAENLSMTFIPEPGDYWIPYFPDSIVYVVGFWDADNSGGDEGPTQNDMIGGYGAPPVDSLDEVQIQPLVGATDIDFELGIQFDTAQFGGN